MEPNITPEQASAEAVHKAKNAAQAIELAREAQLARTVEVTAERTKRALLEGLKEVFGDSDSGNPGQMKVLVRRIPVLCNDVKQIHADIGEIKDNQKWSTRLVIGGMVSIFCSIVVGVSVMLITTHLQ